MDVLTLLSSISLYNYRDFAFAFDKNSRVFVIMVLYTVLGFFFWCTVGVGILARFAGWLHTRENIVCRWVAYLLIWSIRVPLWAVKKFAWLVRIESISPEVTRGVAYNILQEGFPKKKRPSPLPTTNDPPSLTLSISLPDLLSL